MLLTNYDFGDADLSGTKKYPIEIGQIVKCQLGDSSADGEFKQVRFVPWINVQHPGLLFNEWLFD